VKERLAGRHSVADKELTLGSGTTTTRDHDLQLADGRILRYQLAGTAHGDAVFLLHGALGSRLVNDSLSVAASDAGIQLVSYDRPGYGGSTPQPGRTVAAAADDVAAIADQLGVDRLAVWGQSAGGPFALACAALLPDWVAAAAVVAPLAPYQASALDWFAGMADDVAQMHRLAVAGRDALQQAMPQLAEVLTSADLARFVEFSSPTLPASDQAILKTDAAAHLFANLCEGLAPGAEGGIEDELALVAPWEIDLAGVRVPVSLWSGEQDTDTPAGHARWLATAIPGAELRPFPEEGHLSLVYGREREVLDWLAQQLAATADPKPPGRASRP
jgi:pimeloyl-ACP methyl ester carboxylesterase